jgi:hypothetical protein
MVDDLKPLKSWLLLAGLAGARHIAHSQLANAEGEAPPPDGGPSGRRM